MTTPMTLERISMNRNETPNFAELDKRDRMVARLGGEGVQDNINDGVEYARLANEAYDAGERDKYNALSEAAAILIGRKSLGALELQSRVVRRDLGQSPTEMNPELAMGMEAISGRFIGLIEKPDAEIMAMTTDELLLATAKAIHRMKLQPSVLAPMELWNREDVLRESIASGRLHPWVAWSARGHADATDLSTPLYEEFLMTNMRVESAPDPLLDIDKT